MDPVQDLTSNIMVQTSTAVLIVKMLVDALKLCWGGDPEKQPPMWVPPISAFVIGIAILSLMGIALEQDLTRGPILAKTIIAGLIAGASALGVTELHTLARGGHRAAPPVVPFAPPPVAPAPRAPFGPPAAAGRG